MADRLLYECPLITGASGGLGQEFARQLAPHCRRMVLVARREKALGQVEEQLRDENPGLEVAVFPVDLTRARSRRDLIGRLSGSKWAPDLLINNAGMGDYGEFVTGDWEKVQQMLELNIGAVTHLAHGFLPDMLRSRHGAILNVSSLASLLPIPDFAVYAASKAYVTSFSEALRLELREQGISVLTVCPGPVHTDFGETAGRQGAPPDSPSREWFFVPREEVVLDALLALQRDQPRTYPGLKVSLLAAGLSILPMALIRYLMSHRPRSVNTKDQ